MRIIRFIVKSLQSFSRTDWIVWIGSMTVLTITFIISGMGSPLALIVTLVGAADLIFIAKGNVLGQFLAVAFALLYGLISFQYHYYGETITYLCMSAPTNAVAAIAWIRNPYNETEVEVAPMSRQKWLIVIPATIITTVVMYFVLGAWNTPQLELSTISVTTSFLAAALMFFRNRFYAVAYMSNDIILIGLWLFATFNDISYLPMVINFIIFFLNDLYGFISWKKMSIRQEQPREQEA